MLWLMVLLRPKASAMSSTLVLQARAALTSIGGSHDEGDSVVRTPSPPKSLAAPADGAATILAIAKLKGSPSQFLKQ
jgi:hypothetical protein